MGPQASIEVQGLSKTFGDVVAVDHLNFAVRSGSVTALLRGWTGVQRGGTVTTSTFTTHAARFASRSLDDLFTAWVEQEALPPLPVAAAPMPRRPSYPPTNARSV